MGKLNKDNLRKTIYYLKKNGMKNTVLAAVERLQKKEYDGYSYASPSEEALETQRQYVWKNKPVFSIVVPLYHTPERYFRELVESVLAQTYSCFELILADASKDEALRSVAESYCDSRVRYIKLSGNEGISQNTNQGILAAKGAFVALLDHDDLLTPDALYEMALAVEKYPEVVLLYTDEDKCDGEGRRFYEPHFKQDYNEDLLLTNNYFCHFTAIRTEVAKKLLLRKDYDGAQDFDLVLRVTALAEKNQVVHIPKVLYHWRCHTGSTAANPESKRYAYEAGKRAVEDYIRQKGWMAKVSHLKHLGFYRVDYEADIFSQRPEVGAVGGRVLDRIGRIQGGMMDAQGNVAFKGLYDGFSGYVNRAALVQQAEALDIRCMKLNPSCVELARKEAGLGGYVTEEGKILWKKLPQNTSYVDISLKLCEVLKNAGYILLWDPQEKGKA